MSSSWFSEIHQDEESYSTWISCFSFFVFWQRSQPDVFSLVRLMASGGHAMFEDENEGRSVQKLEDWPDFKQKRPFHPTNRITSPKLTEKPLKIGFPTPIRKVYFRI